MKLSRLLRILSVAAALVVTVSGMAGPETSMKNEVQISHIKHEIDVRSLDDAAWRSAAPVVIDNYWSGTKAPVTRRATVRLLWSATALYVRFEAEQHEPLVVSEKPDLSQKIRRLWDRDVCEIFIAPDKEHRNKYFEFEIAPTGEWIDLAIEVTPEKRLTDWNYQSNMSSFSRIEKDKVVMAVKIPFAALGKTPKAGDVWLGNMFRCVGKDATRGYLAWRPTKTKEPAFHRPEAFGEFIFSR